MERHPTDLVSLVFGVLFALTGLAFLVADVTLLTELPLHWVVPLAVLVLGLWLLVSAARSQRPAAEQDGGGTGPGPRTEPQP